MRKTNPFDSFLWERDGNGNYLVTEIHTGISVLAIPCSGKERRYRIRESEEWEVNCYGQSIPKRYTRFEVMEFCQARGSTGKIDTLTREEAGNA